MSRKKKTQNFTFFLNIEGTGDDPQEAWEDAIEKLQDALARGEFDTAPVTIYEKKEPIPAADLLSGKPFQEFGINHGETESEAEE